MSKSIVFFGHEHHGKSTLLGYLYSCDVMMDVEGMDSYFKSIRAKYDPTDLYALIFSYETDNSKFGGRGNTTKTNRHKMIEYDFFDTPGHDGFYDERDKGLAYGDIGVFCIEASEFSDNSTFDEAKYSLILKQWIITGKKLIIALTKMDKENVNFSQSLYGSACAKIRALKGCDSAPIIPVAVLVKARRAINLILNNPSEMSWYKGKSLTEAIEAVQS